MSDQGTTTFSTSVYVFSIFHNSEILGKDSGQGEIRNCIDNPLKSFAAKGTKNMSGSEYGRWTQGFWFWFGFKLGKIIAGL